LRARVRVRIRRLSYSVLYLLARYGDVMPNITFRAPEDVKDDLDERADEQNSSRTDVILSCIREGLYDDDNTEQQEATRLQERITELEKELDSVRMERERLRGKVEALEDQLEDLRGYRDNVSAELARAPAIEGVTEDGDVVVEEEEEEGSGWWPF